MLNDPEALKYIKISFKLWLTQHHKNSSLNERKIPFNKMTSYFRMKSDSTVIGLMVYDSTGKIYGRKEMLHRALKIREEQSWFGVLCQLNERLKLLFLKRWCTLTF